MVMLLGAQTAIIGAVQVFIVVVAIQLLDIGYGGVGYLNAAMGSARSSAPSARCRSRGRVD